MTFARAAQQRMWRDGLVRRYVVEFRRRTPPSRFTFGAPKHPVGKVFGNREAALRWWMVGAAMNGVILVAYVAICITIARGLLRSGQWRSNPLALATSAIFFTCGVHHGAHVLCG